MKEIWDKLKVDFEYYTGGKYIGLVKAIGAGFASRLSEFTSKLNFIEKQAFIETADRDYLYLHTGDLLPPKGSEVAEGFVVFFGDVGATVPLGIEIKDDNADFKTTSQGVVGVYEFGGNVSVVDGVASLPANLEVPSCDCVVNGVSKRATSSNEAFSFEAGGLVDTEAVTVRVNKSGLVSVKCAEAGLSGNRSLSDKLKTKVTVQGLNKELGVVSIEGGKDAESVEDYRQRVKHWYANPQAPFSVNNIRAVLLEEVPTLKYVWVKGGEVEDGHVKVFVINKEYGLTAEESGRVVELVQGLRPAQMRPDYIETGLPIINTTDVVIENLSPSHEEMKEQVRKNIEFLFDTDMFERGMSHDEIESMVYRTELNGERVTSFDIHSGQCSPQPYTFWRLGHVVFQ